MKSICAVAVSFAVVAAGLASAQTATTADRKKAAMEKVQPGPEHAELAALDGRWTQEITYNAGGKPLKGQGSVTNRMILGGRYLVSERTSKTDAGAMGNITVDAMSIYGFDRRTNQFTIIELDTLGTYWVSAAGTPRSDKTILMSGETLDDHGGKAETRQYDMVLRVIDPDTYVTQIIFKFPNRPPLTLVETMHRRVK